MGRGRGGGKRGGVSFTKPPEPAFLRKMKEQLGFQEGPNVDTKRAELDEATPEDEQDRDDERPTVVVLKSGDLTAEQAEQLGAFEGDDNEKNEDGSESGGRVMFRKPTKRPNESTSETEIRSKIEKKESSMKKVKNKTLLSFDDEEDDDDDSS